MTDKAALYESAISEIESICDEEGGPKLDAIAVMATICSVLSGKFPTFYWTGFYRIIDDDLLIGPYIGTVGCLQIPIGKGVCGTAAAERKTIIVPDVQEFPGHIACDANTRSEIVVPVFDIAGDLMAVLDVDSKEPDAFDEADRVGLEKLCAIFRGYS